ncbi:unnamed protein product [Rotaria sp. Silwood2]|nr:unnamed protein product [Rotaria sp. Silwood2]
MVQKFGRKNIESEKNKKQALSTSTTKNKKVAFKLIGFDTSDEENKSPDKQRDSLTAIQNTLQTIFSSSSQAAPGTSTKRTMLKQTNGKIMTENDVIEQLEEIRRKKKEKQSRSTNRETGARQRRTMQKNGMFSQT